MPANRVTDLTSSQLIYVILKKDKLKETISFIFYCGFLITDKVFKFLYNLKYFNG